MNKQVKKKNGVIVSRGIEWTNWSWNPVAGCFHGCRWKMPNTSNLAKCYAETTAQNIAGQFYPHGFEHHYWHNEKLLEPLRVWVIFLVGGFRQNKSCPCSTFAGEPTGTHFSFSPRTRRGQVGFHRAAFLGLRRHLQRTCSA